MLGTVAGVELALYWKRVNGSMPRLVSQSEWEGDRVYEDSAALCPQMIIIQLPKALSEGQGAQPYPSGYPAD